MTPVKEGSGNVVLKSNVMKLLMLLLGNGTDSTIAILGVNIVTRVNF